LAQADRQSGQSWGASYSLFLLFLANLLHIADRSLPGIVVDPVKADLLLSDTQMSLVSGTAFVVFNLVVGILIAGWVDRGNRKRILVAGVALWSGATALTGLAEGFYSLAATRALVGIGEATAFPVAISMIADLFVPERRARAVGLFQSSVFAGVVIGSIAAGVLAAAYGWRSMFVICGVIGFGLVVLMMLTMREPQRGRHDQADAFAQRPPKLGAAVLQLLRVPGFLLLTFGTGVGSMLGAVLPLALLASAMQMLVATFARSFKEAQTYLQLLMMLPMIPGMMMVLSPIQSQLWMFAVPVLGQELLVSELMRGEPLGTMPFVLSTVGCVALAAACLAAISRLLSDEKIVFGRS